MHLNVARCCLIGALASLPLCAAAADEEPMQPAMMQDDTCPSCAAADEQPEPPAVMEGDTCPGPPWDPGPWLDKAQDAMYQAVCRSGAWIDHLLVKDDLEQQFADREERQPARRADGSYGRVSAGIAWDRRDGVDPSLRLRAHIPLPAIKENLRLLVGRGTERQAVEERDDEWAGSTIPDAFRDAEDPAWLVGLGYGRDTDLEQGWEFDAGVRVRMHPDLIVKSSYRHDFPLHDDTLTRFRQTFFWQAQRGLGTTSQVNLDHMLGSKFMIRWANGGTVAEDTDGLDWNSALSLYEDLSHGRWISYTALVSGATTAEVPLQDYGVEVRFRTPFLREWLFFETSASVTWPRYLESEQRELNPGVGARVEMFFGRTPNDYVR